MPLDCDDTLGNGIIASQADHPILKECIDTLGNSWALYPTTPETSELQKLINVVLRSGPYHFQKAFYAAARTYQERCIALPKSYFFPIDYIYTRMNKFKSVEITQELLDKHIKPETFAIHCWAHSWLDASTVPVTSSWEKELPQE